MEQILAALRADNVKKKKVAAEVLLTKAANGECFQQQVVDAVIGIMILKDFEEVAVAIALKLASTNGMEALLYRAGAVPALVRLLSSSIQLSRERTALVLMNIAVLDEVEASIGDCGGIEALVRLLGPNRTIAETNNAMGALENTTANMRNRSLLIDLDGMSLMTQLLAFGTSRQKEHAAVVVRNLCADENVRLQLGTTNTIQLLLSISCEGDVDARERALAALCRLAESDQNRKQFGTVNTLRSLMQFLKKGSSIEKALTANLFREISYIVSNARMLGELGAIRLLIDLAMTSSDVTGQGASALEGLTQIKANRTKIRELNGITVLLELMRSPSRSRADFRSTHAFGAVRNLLADTENVHEVVRNKGLDIIIDTLANKETPPQEKVLAIASVWLMSMHKLTSEKIVARGTLALVRDLVQNGTRDERIYAVPALQNLEASSEHLSLAHSKLVTHLCQHGNGKSKKKRTKKTRAPQTNEPHEPHVPAHEVPEVPPPQQSELAEVPRSQQFVVPEVPQSQQPEPEPEPEPEPTAVAREALRIATQSGDATLLLECIDLHCSTADPHDIRNARDARLKMHKLEKRKEKICRRLESADNVQSLCTAISEASALDDKSEQVTLAIADGQTRLDSMLSSEGVNEAQLQDHTENDITETHLPEPTENETEEKFCRICLDAARSHVFVPCGHVVCCESCSDEIMKGSKECPLCRRTCEMAIRFYI